MSATFPTNVPTKSEMDTAIAKAIKAAAANPPIVIPPVVVPPVVTPPISQFRLFGPTSPWNTVKAPTSFNAAADADIKKFGFALNNGDFGHPFYRAKLNDPLTTFHLGAGEGFPANVITAPAPVGMKPTPIGDRVMSVLLADGTLLDMYGVTGTGNNFTAQFYCTSDGVNGTGFGVQGSWARVGTTAIGSPQAAGTILDTDVAAGVIPHALFMAFDYSVEGGEVAPAVGNDDGGAPGHIPQGGLLFSTLTPAQILALSPGGRMLATAASTYGVYVCDQAGGAGEFYGDDSAAVGAAFTQADLNVVGNSLRLVG